MVRGLLLVFALVGTAAAATFTDLSQSGTLIEPFLATGAGPRISYADQIYMVYSAETALNEAQPGQAAAWLNPDNGHTGWAMPLSGAPGRFCRDIRQVVRADADLLDRVDEACRVPNGSWRRSE